ncbi:hypothetical protein JTE90_027014 [Oedothorax gibbosus]|uniref:Uncharacterized protein n=1 Tax=Oedothorax gibbosus TaxID=931172 RepID=A0AAV6V990_9ARAC|nr:hypothetical protein JTE90_027014 [Oedothorax gibbosus]
MEDSWLKILFGRSSFLTQTLLGGSETYAVPSRNRLRSASVPSRNVASPSRIHPIASQFSPKSSSSISAVQRGLRSKPPTRNQKRPIHSSSRTTAIFFLTFNE